MNPRVSLITTVHNRQRFLPACLDSAIAQTFGDWELILLDDGSTDDSLAITQDYARRDPRIRLTAAPHRGRGPALKDAHDQARGEFVGWLDSDDLLLPDALALTVAAMDAHPQAGVVYSDYYDISDEGRILGPGFRCRIPFNKQRLLIDFMSFHFRLIRREIFDKAGGIDPDFQFAVDYDLCLRLSEITDFYHLPRPLYHYRLHPQTMGFERRLDQIRFSKKAIENALVRRGMDQQFELNVELIGKFILNKKSS